MNIAEQRERVPELYSLRQVFIDATLHHNRALNSSIKKLDLGIFVEEANVLRKITANNPEHREAAKTVLIINDKYPLLGKFNVVVEKEHTLGEPSHVKTFVDIRVKGDDQERRVLFKHQRQDRFRVTTIHSHPGEIPPSPNDLLNILTDDIENPHAYTCVFVVNPKSNYLVFRGPKTPKKTKSDISELEKVWDEKIDRAEKMNFFRMRHMSDKERQALHSILQQEILNEFIRNYGLLVFTGPAESSIVSRVTA